MLRVGGRKRAKQEKKVFDDARTPKNLLACADIFRRILRLPRVVVLSLLMLNDTDIHRHWGWAVSDV